MRVGGGSFVALLLALLGVAANGSGAESGADISMAFDGAELTTVVEAVARATGQQMILDPSLRGRITITAEDAVTAGEALEMLNAALLLSGFAMAPGPDGSLKILPLPEARQGAPWRAPEQARESERLLVALVRLESADARSIERVLRSGPLSSGLVIPYPLTNSLILATTELHLQRLLEVVRSLDQGTSTGVQVIPLRWAEAGRALDQLTEYLQEDPESTTRILADARTNSLIVKGSPEQLAKVKDFVRILDVPASGSGVLHVVRVHNADVEDLAPKLAALAGDREGPLSGADFQVIAEAPTNSLIIRAGPDVFGELADLIAELDVQPRQVSLDVQILDISIADRTGLGISWIAPLTNTQNPGDPIGLAKFGRILPFGVLPPDSQFFVGITRAPLVIPIVDDMGNPDTLLVPQGQALLEAGSGEVYANMMSHPHLLAASGEEQHIFAGDNIPVLVASTATPGAELFSISANIERLDVGIDLRVTPRARSRDLVEVDLAVEVSSVVPSEITGVSDEFAAAAAPIIRQTKLEATVVVEDGAIMLVAAEPRETVTTAVSSVPFLGSIPILGHFFSQRLEISRRSHVVITVQATVLDTREERRADSLLRKLAFERQMGRVGPLQNPTRAPYVLLVSTLREPGPAEQLAEQLKPRGPVEIVPWMFAGETRYDVYRTGFFEVSQAGLEAVELRGQGFQPKLMHVGGQEFRR